MVLLVEDAAELPGPSQKAVSRSLRATVGDVPGIAHSDRDTTPIGKRRDSHLRMREKCSKREEM
jgi:hypothetical protein